MGVGVGVGVGFGVGVGVGVGALPSSLGATPPASSLGVDDVGAEVGAGGSAGVRRVGCSSRATSLEQATQTRGRAKKERRETSEECLRALMVH